jgi:hypothetical protein
VQGSAIVILAFISLLLSAAQNPQVPGEIQKLLDAHQYAEAERALQRTPDWDVGDLLLAQI